MPTQEAVNPFVQYVNIIIPLVISVVSAIITFMVYKSKVDRLESDMKDIKEEMKQVRDKAVACEATQKANEPYIKRKSPLSLTDRGNKLLENSGGKRFVDENFENLNKLVDAKGSKTPYDVQESSKIVLEEMQGDDKFDSLKEYLFKEGIEIENLIVVMGIYLRDKILEGRGWSVADVDKHDPSKKKEDPLKDERD